MLIDPRSFRRLVRARDLLADDSQERTTVLEIAREVGATPYQLIRQFAALFGTTPHQFRTRVRLDRAKTLIAGGAPVTEEQHARDPRTLPPCSTSS